MKLSHAHVPFLAPPWKSDVGCRIHVSQDNPKISNSCNNLGQYLLKLILTIFSYPALSMSKCEKLFFHIFGFAGNCDLKFRELVGKVPGMTMWDVI